MKVFYDDIDRSLRLTDYSNSRITQIHLKYFAFLFSNTQIKKICNSERSDCQKRIEAAF